MTGKFLQNVFSIWEPIFLSFDSDSIYNFLKPESIFSQNGLWSVPNKQNRTFYSIFTRFLDSNFLRYGQDLYKPYIRDSLVSSSPIGPL